ncbi:MAG: pseudouridine synthase, partial [Pseudomonadota bacterium]
GRVRLNGKLLREAGVVIGPADRVIVDGRPLPAFEVPRLWRFHKPKGLVTSTRDPMGRPTFFDNLPPELPRVMTVGRLDFNTEGLLLLTNDGGLARHLELPATAWLRRYRVRAKGRVRQKDLDQLAGGVQIDDVDYGPIEASLDSVSGANAWLTVALREGKNREVRNILAHLGLEVNRLIRISFGPFQLHDLAPGVCEHVRRKTLVEQLGPKVSDTFGLVQASEENGSRPTKLGASKSRPIKAGARRAPAAKVAGPSRSKR